MNGLSRLIAHCDEIRRMFQSVQATNSSSKVLRVYQALLFEY